jgi:hypothetical protein
MNDESKLEISEGKKEKDLSGGPPMWLQASQWGASLVGLTCLLGFGGYWIGEKLGGGFLSIALLLVGLVLGFGGGMYRIYKASEAMGGPQKDPSKIKPLPPDDGSSDY